MIVVSGDVTTRKWSRRKVCVRNEQRMSGAGELE